MNGWLVWRSIHRTC